MINELNVKIFDYIFSVNISKEENEEKSCDQLSQIISSLCEEYDFWSEYKFYFNDKCVIDASTLGGKHYVYNGFPRMKLNTKQAYLKYKLSQVKNIVENNGDFIGKEFEKITELISDEGKKEILDYCKDCGIIQYEGKVFLAADNNPACYIIYENIRAILSDDSDDAIFPQNVFVVNGNSNTFGNVEQNVNSKNNDDKLFDMILSKLSLLEQEGVSQEILATLKEECEKKNKRKVVDLLKEIATGVAGSVVSAGIMHIFGL